MKQPYEVPSLWRFASPFFFLFVVVALSAPSAVRADVCSIDEMPAATLLLPYFEVDPSNPSGLTTLFAINNAGAAAVLANVQVWTDLGVPTLGFQVYLTGYDVQTINLRDVFNGSLPQTAPAGQDPLDTISPKGMYSQDLNFPDCAPLPYQPLPGVFVAHLRAAHSGQFSAILNGCAGMDLGDGRLRGYVTVDTVSDCTLRRAGDAGYFGAGGVVTNQNVLWGDVIYLDPANQYSDGDNLVRIKAFPGAFPGAPTFYGRYVGGSGADQRQPLPLTWGSRYVDGGAFSGGTDLIVWQDSERVVKPFACGTLPAGFPLRHSQITLFDEQEQTVVPPPVFPRPPDPTENAFPAEANKVHIGGASFPVPYAFGWTFLDLRAPNGFPQPSLRQSWVATSLKAQGQYSVGFSATPLGSVCDQAVPSVGLAAGAAAEVRP